MRVAFMADIHANREALEACLAHAREQHADRLVFLGDYVNYGADPESVVVTLMDHVEKGGIALRGNHDAAVGERGESMTSPAEIALEWTRNALGPAHRAFLAGLPLTHAEDGFRCMHADASAPSTWSYVMDTEDAARALRATTERLTLCGHVHRPALYNVPEGFGAAGAAGAAGGSGNPTTGTGTVGQPCRSSTECTAGLSCITATDKLLGGGAPPHGMCSAACMTDQDCPGKNSVCYSFDNFSGYCLESCEFGPVGLGAPPKCHDRPDFACLPAALGATSQGCITSASCQDGEVCSNGACNVVFPACLPACRGDIDCAPGLYCDQSFLGGTCIAKKPTGKRLGEACTVASEPDDCLGFCLADQAGSKQGHCAADCGLGHACAYDDETGRFDGACLSVATLTANQAAPGDFGYCTPVCTCSSDCNDPTLDCTLQPQGPLPADNFNGPGLCFEAGLGDPVLSCNGGSGAGGAAGAGTAGDGSGGQAAATGGVGGAQ